MAGRPGDDPGDFGNTTLAAVCAAFPCDPPKSPFWYTCPPKPLSLGPDASVKLNRGGLVGPRDGLLPPFEPLSV
jgi:hypothetical protein